MVLVVDHGEGIHVMSRISSVQEKYRLNDLCYIHHDAQGPGPVMAKETFDAFVDADPSHSGKYLEWMLFQAGGGQDAMQRVHSLWIGENETDRLAQRRAMRASFIKEAVNGYVDVDGQNQPPVDEPTANRLWREASPGVEREFHVGDEDVAVAGGFGFYRLWVPIYTRIVDAVRAWHTATPALKAQSKKRPGSRIELDIYARWSFSAYDQSAAVYGTLDSLEKTLNGVRTKLLLADIRYEKVYEDDLVNVVCPLTIGASIKYGVDKWCTANSSNVEAMHNYLLCSHWERYLKRGPVVYWCWKVPMPAHLWRMAVHLSSEAVVFLRRDLLRQMPVVDTMNGEQGTTYGGVRSRIQHEHQARLPKVEGPHARYIAYGNRSPGRAWLDASFAARVLHSLDASMSAVGKWYVGFDMRKIVLECS